MKILSKLNNTGMIEEVADKRYVTDAEKSAWNSKPDTDTVTTINGKTGAITKEDIVALGIPGDGGPIVDLGTFNDQTELITHVVMNQPPTGHYTFTINDSPNFMLLSKFSDTYRGTIHNSITEFYYFSVSFYGEVLALKFINLTDLSDFVDLDSLSEFESLRDFMNTIAGSVENLYTFKADRVELWDSLELKADKTYVDSKVQTDVPADAKFTDTVTTINGQIGDIELTGDDLDYFDYKIAEYKNVGITLNELVDSNDFIAMVLSYVLGEGYDIFNDPTLKEILEIFTIVLGNYELGIAPSLGEIVEMFAIVLGNYELGTAPSLGKIVEEMESNKITVGKTQPNSGWWFEEID